MAELVHQTWTRITGKPWSEAKKLGLTNGSAGSNTALQKKLLSGYNPYAGASQASNPTSQPQPTQSAPAQPDPMEAYKKAITDWYSRKPATPGTFTYSVEQEQADKRSVGEQYKPFYQEQADQSGDNFEMALKSAREGFSRRGLWGAAGSVAKEIDPATGLALTKATAPTTTGGPVSGMRIAGEQQIGKVNDIRNTSFGRAYTEAVAGGVQSRKAEAKDVYDKTIRQPYEEQYKTWLNELGALQARK